MNKKKIGEVISVLDQAIVHTGFLEEHFNVLKINEEMCVTNGHYL